MGLLSLFNSFLIADSGMASHSDWKSVFFRLGHLRSYFPSAANNRLCGQALMAALRSGRIPNTFISASAERESDGQISSYHLCQATYWRTENAAFIYLSICQYYKIQYLAVREALIFCLSKHLFESPLICNCHPYNLVNILNRFFFFKIEKLPLFHNTSSLNSWTM